MTVSVLVSVSVLLCHCVSVTICHSVGVSIGVTFGHKVIYIGNYMNA